MKRIIISLTTGLLIHSCTLPEIFTSTKVYEWDIDTTSIFVSTDKFSRVELQGKRIPEEIIWSASPRAM
jgi:hypothetical protein